MLDLIINDNTVSAPEWTQFITFSHQNDAIMAHEKYPVYNEDLEDWDSSGRKETIGETETYELDGHAYPTSWTPSLYHVYPVSTFSQDLLYPIWQRLATPREGMGPVRIVMDGFSYHYGWFDHWDDNIMNAVSKEQNYTIGDIDESPTMNMGVFIEELELWVPFYTLQLADPAMYASFQAKMNNIKHDSSQPGIAYRYVNEENGEFNRYLAKDADNNTVYLYTHPPKLNNNGDEWGVNYGEAEKLFVDEENLFDPSRVYFLHELSALYAYQCMHALSGIVEGDDVVIAKVYNYMDSHAGWRNSFTPDMIEEHAGQVREIDDASSQNGFGISGFSFPFYALKEV